MPPEMVPELLTVAVVAAMPLAPRDGAGIVHIGGVAEMPKLPEMVPELLTLAAPMARMPASAPRDGAEIAHVGGDGVDGATMPPEMVPELVTVAVLTAENAEGHPPRWCRNCSRWRCAAKGCR